VSTLPIITLDGVRILHPHNPKTSLLNDVSWQVEAGSFWVVAGLQGSGKSALLETIAGIRPQASGSVQLFGETIPVRSDDALALTEIRRRMGLLFKGNGRLFPALSVLENLALPRCYHRNETLSEAASDLAPLIDYLELDGLLEQIPSHLGSSWSRRVALGRALAQQPELILLDNPLSGLDTTQMRWWRNFLRDASRGHPALGGHPLTLVITTDELTPLLPLGHQFALTHAGRWTVLGDRASVHTARSQEGVREILGEIH
jgi:ABC-type transporter Mla maintaining outer membrane lipid asymmetry ATPase subunit MlaF